MSSKVQYEVLHGGLSAKLHLTLLSK